MGVILNMAMDDTYLINSIMTRFLNYNSIMHYLGTLILNNVLIKLRLDPKSNLITYMKWNSMIKWIILYKLGIA